MWDLCQYYGLKHDDMELYDDNCEGFDETFNIKTIEGYVKLMKGKEYTFADCMDKRQQMFYLGKKRENFKDSEV